jgi:hypothetical protein
MIRNLCAALLFGLAGSAQAATLVYDFNDFNGDLFAPTSVPANAGASNVSIANAFGGLCWNTDIGVTDDFACGGFGSSTLGFTVTPDAGYRMNLGGFSFEGLGVAPDTGPTGFAVYSSLDNFGTALLSGSLLGVQQGQRIFYDVALQAANLIAPFELHVVSTGRDGLPASAWLLDNFRLDLTLEPVGTVPEPSSLALLLAAGFGLGAARRRSRA